MLSQISQVPMADITRFLYMQWIAHCPYTVHSRRGQRAPTPRRKKGLPRFWG